MIRTAFVALFLGLFVLLLGPPLVLHAVLTGSAGLLYRIALGGLRFAMRIAGVHVRVEGIENIPAGVCLFVANHTSAADPPAILTSIPRQVATLVKKELFRIPILSWALRVAHFVPVDRSDRDAAVASVDRAVEYMKDGMSFLVYAEGTRSPDGRLRPFKRGSFVLAIKAGVPIVPIACVGAHRVMRKNELAIRPGEVVVRFCASIDAALYTYEQREQLTALVHAAIAAVLPADQQPLD